MADKITLPPLPGWAYRTTETENGIRARDLAVAAMVLEAAAKAWNEYEDEETRAATFIRALEFTHD